MTVYPIDRHGDGQHRRRRTQPPRPAHPQRALMPGSGARQNTLLKPRPRFGASIIGQGGIKQLSCEEVAAASVDVFLLVHVHSLALVLAVRGNRPNKGERMNMDEKENIDRSSSDLFATELLDAALTNYRSAEPGPGLEQRILASARARHQRALWVGWAWRLGAAAAGPGLALAGY